MDGHILFIHHVMVDEHLHCFRLLAIRNKGAGNICFQVLVWMHLFIPLGVYLGVGLLGPYGSSMFIIWRKYCTGSQSDAIYVFIHSPRSRQHLLLSVFFILVILVHVKWSRRFTPMSSSMNFAVVALTLRSVIQLTCTIVHLEENIREYLWDRGVGRSWGNVN